MKRIKHMTRIHRIRRIISRLGNRTTLLILSLWLALLIVAGISIYQDSVIRKQRSLIQLLWDSCRENTSRPSDPNHSLTRLNNVDKS